MSYNLSHYLLLCITWNKINLSFSLSITQNFIFFRPTNQSIFFYPTSPFLPTNQLTFLHLTFRKLSSLITLQRPTRDGSVAATRPSIHIAHHFIKDGGVTATKPSIHIAHHPTRHDGVAATRPSIHIAHHLLSFVWSS